jgi:hypothetical protein
METAGGRVATEGISVTGIRKRGDVARKKKRNIMAGVPSSAWRNQAKGVEEWHGGVCGDPTKMLKTSSRVTATAWLTAETK